MVDPRVSNRWWLVVAASLSIFMATLDVSIVNLALPTIGHDLRAEPALTQWVVLGYFLPMVVLVLPSGRWVDMLGRRPAFVLGILGFAAASAAASFAPSTELLVAARLIQGSFAAVISAVAPALVALAVRPEARGRAFGIMGSLGPLGAVAGPPVGGWLLAAFGWPAIFLVNVPLCLIVTLIAYRTIEAGGELRPPGWDWLRETLLLGGAVTALLGGLTLAASTAVWALACLLAIPLLLLWSRLSTSGSLVRLVRLPNVGVSLAGMALLIVATGVWYFLAPFYLREFLGTDPGSAGLALLAWPLTMALTAPVAGVLSDRFGARRIALAGTLVAVVDLVLVLPISASWSLTEVAVRLALAGASLGLFVAPNGAIVMASSPVRSFATVAGALGLARNFGFAAGPVIAVAVWASSGYELDGIRYAVAVGAAMAILASVLTARVASSPARAPVRPERVEESAGETS
jgi:MFS family permease